jgi:hypothetical protein
MSSQLYVYGEFTFPKNTRSVWMNSSLQDGAKEDDDHDEEGVTFQGESEHQTVEEAIDGADDVYCFLDLIDEGEDLFLIRGVLGDDEWYPWTTTLGAMARSAARLGATGYIEVLDDGSFVGRLELSKKTATFKEAVKQKYKAHEEALLARLDEWLEAQKPAKKRASKKIAKRR